MRILLVGLTFVTLSCRQVPQEEAPKPKALEVVTVAVRIPVKHELRRDASITAEFRAYQQVELFAKISGYLHKISVDVGSRVKEGDVIAVLDAPELQAEVDQAVAARNHRESEVVQAKAEVNRVQAAVELARAHHERLVSVNRSEAGLVAQQEVDEAMAKRRAAEAQAASVEAQVSAAQRQLESARASEARVRAMLDYTRVVAPFSGVILKRFADPGALIQAGVTSRSQALPLVRLADTARLRLVANVPETIAGRIRVGQPVQVKVPSLTLTMPAKLSRFTENMQADSRTTEVEIDIANPSRAILPGMVADVVIDIGSRSDALTIPIQALANLGGNRYVMVVNPNGLIEERQIKTGFEGSTEVEVLNGLEQTDQVITSSRTLLQPGMRVQVKVEVASR